MVKEQDLLNGKCDECHSNNDVKHCEVMSGTSFMEIDLCADCRKHSELNYGYCVRTDYVKPEDKKVVI